MIPSPQFARPRLEWLDPRPPVSVDPREYHRLLGFPRRHPPGDRAGELAAWARAWFAGHGRPWVYLREAALELSAESLRLDGREFRSPRLHGHLRKVGATRAILLATSAGRECEEHARELWEQEKPDEYFFLEVFGSAVVEQMVASANGRICDLADHAGLVAAPHFSPGYAGWDVAEQGDLFALITQGLTTPLPQPLEVLPSGMLRPKKSLLAVVGLAPRPSAAQPSRPAVPCPHCSLSPCQFRRAPYRQGPVAGATANPIPPLP